MPANGEAIILQQESAFVPATPVELLRLAVEQNANLDQITKLMDLQERWERNEARKAFVAAMNIFKAEPTKILKSKRVSFETKAGGQKDYNYAPLNEVCDAVIAGLSKVGISHRWKIEQQGEIIRVICVLTHELGYSEETPLQGPPDPSGSKNPVQAIASTVSYLQRYTLLAAVGLAAADQDTDGRVATQASGISAKRVEELVGEIVRAADLVQLKKVFAFAYLEADKAKDRAAMTRYIAAKDQRKKFLSGGAK
ncbi:MAG: ERF family protein [Acidobacteria bacterium]|nr:ERF family protein [Acidobacteriota bacterium]